MSINQDFHISFTQENKSYEVDLHAVNKPAKNSIAIGGKNYSLLGRDEDIEKFRSHIQISGFENISEFTASLEKSLGPAEKSRVVFQKILGDSTVKDAELRTTVPAGAGAIVAISEQGKEPRYICMGNTSVNGGRLVDENTAALIGSGAKMFTALLSKILSEKEGSPLTLDSKLSDFMREEHFDIFEDPELAKKITLEMLLSHTSGLQYYGDDYNNARAGQTLDQILSGMAPHGVRFIAAPGDGIYSYSNRIGLAAVVIEKAYKKMVAKDLIDKGELRGNQTLRELSEIEPANATLSKLPPQILDLSLQGLLDSKSPYINGVYVYDLIDQFLMQVNHHRLSYVDILQRELLGPLDMTRTGFDKPKDDNVLRAYRSETGKNPSSMDVEILDPMMRGAGGLWSSMGDIMKLAGAYKENGLWTKSENPRQLISEEGIRDMARVRGINGITGLALNVEGPFVGKGGSISSYEYSLRIDPAKGSVVARMCNFLDTENYKAFEQQVSKLLPGTEEAKADLVKLTPEEVELAAKGFPMEQCDQFFKGDRGIVGVKFTGNEPGVILNWNGETLPVRKIDKGLYLILGGGFPGGQALHIIEVGTRRYAIIEKGDEANTFKGILKEDMFFPKDMAFLQEAGGASGVYKSVLSGGPPPIKVEVDASKGISLTMGDLSPVPGLVTNIVKSDGNKISEIWVQANLGPFPPDKLFKLVVDANGAWSLVFADFMNPANEVEKVPKK